MEKFELKESVKVPRILIDFKRGKIRITGKSTLENPKDLYPGLINVFNKYISNPQPKTFVLIDLEYYNSESSIYLFKIIEMLVSLETNKKSQLKISWHYDPDDYWIIKDINNISIQLNFKINALAYEVV